MTKTEEVSKGMARKWERHFTGNGKSTAFGVDEQRKPTWKAVLHLFKDSLSKQGHGEIAGLRLPEDQGCSSMPLSKTFCNWGALERSIGVIIFELLAERELFWQKGRSGNMANQADLTRQLWGKPSVKRCSTRFGKNVILSSKIWTKTRNKTRNS